jgi:hypothetical protein
LSTGKQVRLEGGLTSFWHRGSQAREILIFLNLSFTKSSSSEKLVREIAKMSNSRCGSGLQCDSSCYFIILLFLLILRKLLQVGCQV